MPGDWLNFTPDKIPTNLDGVESLDVAVPADTAISGDPTEITMGPKKVFKRGYPTGKTVGSVRGEQMPKISLKAVGPHQLMKTTDDPATYEKAHKQEKGEFNCDRCPPHKNENATVPPRHVSWKDSRRPKHQPVDMSPVVASEKTELLTLHGVTDGSKVFQILHSQDLGPLASIVAQKALIVTSDYKVIDIAAHEWPINLESATDVRATLKNKVKYGDQVGIVAGINGDHVMVKTASGSTMVAVHDLEPIMGGMAGDPNEDIAAIFDVMAPGGTIRIKQEGDSFHGEGDKDREILIKLIGSPTFQVMDYDNILNKVGEAGYSLEQDIVEEVVKDELEGNIKEKVPSVDEEGFTGHGSIQKSEA